jgi:hypothetical protein
MEQACPLFIHVLFVGFLLGTRVMDFIHVTISLVFETVNSREVIEMVTGFFHIGYLQNLHA